VTDGGSPHGAAGTDLDELLATLAEAPDLASSAAFLLSRLGELSGSSRGFVYLLDPAFEMFCVAAMVGFDDGDNVLPSSVNDLSHPVVVSALSLHPIWSGAESAPDRRLPFARWVALPLPRGDDRAGPSVLLANRAADLIAPFGMHMGMRPRRMQEWFGHAPAGVVVLEGTPNASVVESLTRVAMFSRGRGWPQQSARRRTVRRRSVIA
jgi:hypothetical protein